MLHQSEIYSVALLAIFTIILNKNIQTANAQNSIGRGTDYVGTDRNNGGAEEFAPRVPAISSHEPSCEELRAMWRFSKRQSRASEITNEIPTYHDPFAYNIWDRYIPTQKASGSMNINARYQNPTPRLVYGRLVHKEPVPRFRDSPPRERGYDDISRLYAADKQQDVQPRRRGNHQFRYSGTSTNAAINQPNVLIPQRGSFQKLKEVMRTERAKELAQQRKAEEMAARAAVLKELTNGQGYPATRYNRHIQKSPYMEVFDDEFNSMDSHLSSDDLLPIPDLLGGSKVYNMNGNRMDQAKLSYAKSDDSFIDSLSPQPRSHFRERNRSALRQMNF